MQKALKGKVAMITGAGGGIGKHIATTYAEAGAQVVIIDLQRDQADRVADEIKRSGGTAIAIATDVSDEMQVEAAVAEAINSYGRLDIVVNNAGTQHIAPIHEIDFSVWKKVLAIQLDGAFLTTRAAFRQMIAQGDGGTLIYMGSVHSHEASKLKSPYVTAKHGLLGLCRTVAKEGAAYGIRSNVICPGYVRTPLVDRQIPEQARNLGISEEEVIEKVFLKDTVDQQFTTLEDVSQTALHLAAFSSNALTGQSIVVSHGWFMQ